MWVHRGKMLRYHGTASDGQRVHMYFTPHKKQRFTVWTLGLYIGGCNRRANDWYNKSKGRSPITGRGGLAPLHLALTVLLKFAEMLPMNAEIHVEYEDERRRRAYQWLGRYPNWYWEPNEHFFFYRNPLFWDRTEDDQLIPVGGG